MNVYEGNGSDDAETGDGVQFWDNVSGTNDFVTATQDNEGRSIVQVSSMVILLLSLMARNTLTPRPSPGILQNESFIIFLVFKQNSWVNGGNDARVTFIIDRPTATDNLTTFKMVSTDKYFYQRRNNTGGNLGGPNICNIGQ